MPRYYADLDNNKLLTGPLSTQIASRPTFYSGNTVPVSVDLIQRDTLQNLQNYIPATGTTISLLLGSATTVISVPALTQASEAGITATATCSLYSTATATGTVAKYSVVTATVTASLYGNTAAQAIAVMTRGTACTLSLAVVTAKTPEFRIGFVSRATAATASISTTSVSNYANPFRSSSIFGPGDTFIDIIQGGFGLYGNPQVYFAKPSAVTFNTFLYENENITNKCTFENGKITAIDPSFIDPSIFYLGSTVSINFSSSVSVAAVANSTLISTSLSASIVVVPDPDYVYSISSASVVCGGSGFPSGVNIPFSIPSDEDGDGRPCTGLMRAINGSVVSVVSISSRGSRFTSSITNGKNYGILPAYKIQDITVTCAGAGYYDSAPTVAIDSTYLIAGELASSAQATAITTVAGGISVILNSSGYGYTATPGVSIQAPRLSDGLRSVTLANTPTGYADGIYGCTVSGPASGTTAAVNMVVTNGAVSFSILNQGTGYVTAPSIVCPAPNLADSVKSITITTGGIGYTSAPTVTIYGAGSGASATAAISNGKVISISVVSPGSGYTGSVTISIAAPENAGKVASITIATGGTNYISAPTISLSGGGGSGAAASATIVNGAVAAISLDDSGSGYVTAPMVTIANSPSRVIYSGVLTVTTAFYTAASAATNLIQFNSTTTLGVSTLIQTSAQLASSL
ncbi:MAG: hypothetical protein EBU96_06845 [Actinobacteria bacterium]|nr:hypothetical protein [Actinomycetota bacterium]